MRSDVLLFSGIADGLCASVLFAAGVMKLGSLAQFGSQVAAYQVLPSRLAHRLGYVIPPAEIAIAISMLFIPQVSALAAVAFAAFCWAIGVNLLRGRTELHCGCFGVTGKHTISRLHLLGNICLALLAAATFIEHRRPSFIAVQIGVSVVVLAGLAVTWHTLTSGPASET
jgi:hypothetical protein